MPDGVNLPGDEPNDAKDNGDPGSSIHLLALADLLTNQSRRVRVMIGLRHRVFAFPTPGMAASDSLQPEPAPPERPVLFHRLEKILRAGGMKSATGPGPAEPGKERRQSPLVNANETPEEQGHR